MSGSKLPFSGVGKTAVIEIPFDCSVNNMASGDIFKLLALKKGMDIKAAKILIETGEASVTLDLGLSTTAATNDDIVDGGSAATDDTLLLGDGSTGATGASYTALYPIPITADTYLTMTIGGAAADTLAGKVILEVSDLSGNND
jgi:hypothetical protein